MLQKNNQGSATVLGMFLSLCLSLGLIHFIYIHQLALNTLRDRRNTYLCFKLMRDQSQKLGQVISLYNQVILSADAVDTLALLIPGAPWIKMGGQAVKKMAKLQQNISLISFLNYTRTQPYCSYAAKTSFARTPYLLGGTGFVRDPQDLVQLRQKEWQVWVPGKKLLLQGSFHLPSSLAPISSIQVQELGASGKLKAFTGSSSSAFSP